MELDIGFRMEIRWIGDDVEFENDEEDEAGARVCGSVRETEEVKQWNSFGKSGNQKTVGCSIQKRKRKRKKKNNLSQLRIYKFCFFLFLRMIDSR